MFGFDPGYVERAPIEHLEYWHGRALAFTRAQAAAGNRQAELERQIEAATKGMR